VSLWSFFVGTSGSQAINTRPTPKNPAQQTPRATPVGTQDSPVLPGQKPNQVGVAVPTQPRKPRPVPWWEADWAKVDRQVSVIAKKRTEIRRDTGRTALAVEGMDYSDVIDIDFAQFGVQGPIHKVQLSTREGASVTRDYITESHADFVKPNLPDIAIRVEPVVPRNPDDGTQVSPQFAADGPPTITYANVIPQVS